MKRQRFDIIVVGGGAIGAATLHFLAKGGITQTLLLEQRSHFARGATGSWAPLIRQYGVLPFYNQYSPQAFRYYRDEMTQDTGTDPGFLTTGSLYFVRAQENSKFNSIIDHLRQCATGPIEILDAFQGRIKFPEFQWFDDEVAVYERLAGMTCPYAVTDAWLDSAKLHGAKALTDRRVVQILTSQKHVTGVRCENGDIFHCDELILAAGPWTHAILESVDVEVPLIVRPIQVNRFQFQKSYSEQQLPFFLDATEMSFGRPMLDGSFSGGYVVFDKCESTSGFRQPLCSRQAAEAKRKLSKRLKWLRTASLVGGVRAMESYTAEEIPFLQYSSQLPNLFIAAGWCCTGFALAPVFAQKIVSLIKSQAKEKLKSVEGVGLCPQTASL